MSAAPDRQTVDEPVYDLPDGYDDAAAFLQEARERFTEATDFDQHNRIEAERDLKFLAGDQWEPDDLKSRAGLPCLTINTLPQYVAQVVGDIRINQPAIKARPAEDADKDLAEVREGQIRAIEQQSNAQAVYINAGQSQVGGGIGNFRAVLDYLSDDVFDRDIFIKPIPNPFAVVWDPMINEGTGRDARYCFVVDEMPRKAYEDKYGKGELPSELSVSLHRDGWHKRDTVRITEYWLIKEREAQIAMLQDGSIVELTAKNKAQLTPHIQFNASGPMVRKTTRKTVCMYLISGTKLLAAPVEYKLSRVPIFRVPGWEVDTGSKRIRWGLVRFARDPTRLKNFWRSVSAQKLALAPRQQWLVHQSALGDSDDFRNAAQSGDPVLVWSGQVQPDRMEPPPIEAALLQEATLNSQDIKDVTGLHDASLGIQGNETSGKAINARQREGDVATYIYQDNLKNAIAECGRVINEWIPQVYDTARSIRVLGADETQKILRVNDPGDPDSVDLSKGKYDIVVETGPSYTTRRVEAAESMREFVQAVPAAAQFAGDLFAKAQDWPLADEIGERLKKALPPGIADDDEEDQSPEAMQARQAQQQQAQQQQQMQMHAAELALNEQAAKVEKLHAEAREIMARAGAAGQTEQATPGALALEQAAVRKANADADAAEANAGIAFFNLSQLTANPQLAMHEASKVEAEAIGAHLGNVSTLMDLHAKPAETALAHATTVKALKEPPKQPAKPQKG